MLMGRVRTHLSSLRKYTYGKHIAVRIEKALMSGGRGSGSGRLGLRFGDSDDCDSAGDLLGDGLGAHGGCDQGPQPAAGRDSAVAHSIIVDAP